MFQQPKDQYRKSGHSHLSPLEESIRQQQKAEEDEITGRHGYDEPKDHKGDGKRTPGSHGQQKRQKHDRDYE